MLRFLESAQLLRWFGALAQSEVALSVLSASKTRLDEEDLHGTMRAVIGLGKVAGLLGLESLQGRAYRLGSKWAEGRASAEVIVHELQELRGDLADAIEEVLLFRVEERDRSYLEERLLSEQAASQFPFSDVELTEAGECLALGRYTAGSFSRNESVGASSSCHAAHSGP